MTEQVKQILNYLKQQQTEKGEFKSQCYLPTAEQPVWYYSGPSPFLTGNVVYCLSEIGDDQAQAMALHGCHFLKSLIEDYGLLRYWEDNSPIMEYNVPCDADDTSLTSYLLQRHNVSFPDNKERLLANRAPDGMFYTWFLPRANNILTPGYLMFALRELIKTRAIFLPNPKIPNNEPISSIYDREAAVDANVLLYLGLNEHTRSTMDKLIRDTQQETYSLQYYDKPCFVHYHLSRAYRNGIEELAVVKDKVYDYCSKISFSHEPREDYLEYVFNALCLQNFGLTDNDLYRQYADHLLNDPMHQTGWKAFKYWTSKQRSWWAGSPEMTAALYAEALHKHENL